MKETQDLFWEQIEIEQKKLKGKSFNVNDEDVNIYGDLFVQKISVGKILSSTYVGLSNKNYIFESPGLKDYIYVDYKPSESRYLKSLPIGEKTDVMISNILDKSEFRLEGSISSIYESKAMDNLNALGEDEIVTAYVKSLSPAGYDLDILHEGLTVPGFMPNTLAGVNKLFDPNHMVGTEIKAMIESYSENEGTYILSRRRYLETLIPKAISELYTNTVYTGWVTGTAPYGIFVQFNECLTGLIHKVNVVPDWKDRFDEIKPGFEIDFYVKEIIKDKIILTQILRETVWDSIESGKVYTGVVKDIKPFGVLVKLDDETVGLIHQSEVEKIGKKVSPGDQIEVKTLYVDRQNRKIFLTPKK